MHPELGFLRAEAGHTIHLTIEDGLHGGLAVGEDPQLDTGEPRLFAVVAGAEQSEFFAETCLSDGIPVTRDEIRTIFEDIATTFFDATLEPDDDGAGRKAFLITGSSLVDAEDEVSKSRCAQASELFLQILCGPEPDDPTPRPARPGEQ